MAIGCRPTIVSLVGLAATLSSCVAMQPPLRTQAIDQLGYFEYREPQSAMTGVVIAAPHAGAAPETLALARMISDHTGAGLVAGYGFQPKRISVEQPVVRNNPHQPIPASPSKRHSVFSELKQILRNITRDKVDLYIGIRAQRRQKSASAIEAVASGFTFEEIQWIEKAYRIIRDQAIGSQAIEKLPLTFTPIDRVSLGSPGVRHHGVLMIAAKGLSLRIPEKLLSEANLRVYGQVLSEWVTRLERLDHEDSHKVPQIQVRLMNLGRFDLIPARQGIAGVVIGAPHGTYDEYTAEIAKQLSYRCGVAAVIARGFTPTQAGGWRINVNRPSEKTYLAPEFEVASSRSREIYNAFKEAVVDAAAGDLRLYFDIHQYGGQSIQVATVGVSKAEAQTLKRRYQQIRDRLLKAHPQVETVSLMIEPLDEVEIGAWSAKSQGILSFAPRSLHFELPLHTALGSEKSREVYIKIFSLLVQDATRELMLSSQTSPPYPLVRELALDREN